MIGVDQTLITFEKIRRLHDLCFVVVVFFFGGILQWPNAVDIRPIIAMVYFLIEDEWVL